MKTVIVLIVAIFVSLVTGASYNGCVNASNREGAYTIRVQAKAQQWASQNSVFAVNNLSIVCTPRDFGNRWPSDYHRCSAISNIQIPGRGIVPLHLLCNIQGCTINPISNQNY